MAGCARFELATRGYLRSGSSLSKEVAGMMSKKSILSDLKSPPLIA